MKKPRNRLEEHASTQLKRLRKHLPLLDNYAALMYFLLLCKQYEIEILTPALEQTCNHEQSMYLILLEYLEMKSDLRCWYYDNVRRGTFRDSSGVNESLLLRLCCHDQEVLVAQCNRISAGLSLDHKVTFADDMQDLSNFTFYDSVIGNNTVLSLVRFDVILAFTSTMVHINPSAVLALSESATRNIMGQSPLAEVPHYSNSDPDVIFKGMTPIYMNLVIPVGNAFLRYCQHLLVGIKENNLAELNQAKHELLAIYDFFCSDDDRTLPRSSLVDFDGSTNMWTVMKAAKSSGYEATNDGQVLRFSQERDSHSLKYFVVLPNSYHYFAETCTCQLSAEYCDSRVLFIYRHQEERRQSLGKMNMEKALSTLNVHIDNVIHSEIAVGALPHPDSALVDSLLKGISTYLVLRAFNSPETVAKATAVTQTCIEFIYGALKRTRSKIDR